MLWDLSDRIIETEVIDHLDASEHIAVRSRRDLRLIDSFLGNSRWITRKLKPLRMGSVVELGAGDGHLARYLSRIYPQLDIIGLDLVPPPVNWVDPLRWIQGDLMETVREATASICIGSLVLHHFDRNKLGNLGVHLQRFSTLIFSEPHRHCQPLTGSYFLQPFMGKVVRHDMPASIKAGFQVGELAELLRLNNSQWAIEEYVTIRGTIRFIAQRL